MLETLVYVVLWTSQCNHVTFLALVWECYLYLVKLVTDTLNSLTLSSNHHSVESLLYKDVT